MKRKRYSRRLQRKAVEQMKSSENVGDLAQELGVTRRCLYKWRTKLDLVEPGEESARPNSHESSYRKQAQQMKRLLAERMLARRQEWVPPPALLSSLLSASPHSAP